MTREMFNIVVEDALRQVREMIMSKGGDYATGADRFSQFYRTAALEMLTPTKSLGCKVSKHIVTVFEWLEEMEKDQKAYREIWQWDALLLDIIVYSLLLRGLLMDTELERRHASA